MYPQCDNFQEYVVNDAEILKVMKTLALEGGIALLMTLVTNERADKTVQYSIANMLVNLTNSFDKPEATEEQEHMKKLGKSYDKT